MFRFLKAVAVCILTDILMTEAGLPAGDARRLAWLALDSLHRA